MAEVINAIRKDNIRYLFTEEQYDDTISNRIENETDAGYMLLIQLLPVMQTRIPILRP